MKGLFYRQFYLSKKSIILSLSILAVMILLEVLVRMSLNFGNLANIENKDELDVVTYNLFIMMNSLLSYGACISEHGILQSDFTSKWIMYSYTLPITEKEQALVKTGWIFSGFIAGTFFSYINYFILSAVSGRSIETEFIWLILIIGLYYSLTESIKIPLLLHFKKESTVTGIILGFCIFFIVMLSVIMGAVMRNYGTMHPELSEDELSDYLLEKAQSLLNSWGWTLPLIIIAVFVIGYILTVKALKRRPV